MLLVHLVLLCASACTVVFSICMAGRMGGDRVTVKNLKVVQIDSSKNEILISGAIPGRRGTLVEITSIK